MEQFRIKLCDCSIRVLTVQLEYFDYLMFVIKRIEKIVPIISILTILTTFNDHTLGSICTAKKMLLVVHLAVCFFHYLFVCV